MKWTVCVHVNNVIFRSSAKVENHSSKLSVYLQSASHILWQYYLTQAEDPLANRTILYQMVALYDYTAQGPEDLEFSEGDTIDILSEGTPTPRSKPSLRYCYLILSK